MELMVAMPVTLTGRTWSSFMSTSMETVEKAVVLGVCVCVCVCEVSVYYPLYSQSPDGMDSSYCTLH